jgi:maltokinase
MTELEAALVRFLPRQRWFAGKGRAVVEVRTEASVPLRTPLPSLHLTVVEVAFADGGQDRYSLPVGYDRGPEARQLAAAHPDAVILETTPPRAGVHYDVVADGRLGAVFLDLIARAATVEELRFHRQPEWSDSLRGPGRPLATEQSNTSLVFGDRLILKLFRRLQPGVNPELELTRALVAQGFKACPPPLGWAEGLGSTLAILQPYYAGSVEGWKLATDRSKDFLGSGAAADNFAAEARELGGLTAEMHAALAGALPVVAHAEPDLGAHSRLLGQLSQVAGAVSELAPYKQAIEAVYARAQAAGGARYLQRIHGDYHLGQVLRSGHDWVVLDWEGEPARSLEERRRLASPLRDVAGMLRSFDYAAFQPLLNDDSEVARSSAQSGGGPPSVSTKEVDPNAWVEANRTAFLDGYTGRAADAGWLQEGYELLLRTYELDKAVYEVMYEARFRPGWVGIPLGGIRRLLGS